MSTKKWYSSKTIWGVLIAGLGFILSTKLQADVQLPQNADFEQLKAYAEAIKDAHGNLGVIAGQLLAGIGSLLAIVGRVKAESVIA
jgi:hypothetical protein